MDYAKSHRSEIYMLDIDEYLTSEICNIHQSCTLQNVESTYEKQKYIQYSHAQIALLYLTKM